jgi:ammonia channel protein AmtB
MLLLPVPIAVTIAVYHLGCYIEYLLGLHDGARVFPVHGMCGFWGVLCVGIFSRSCLIREIYEDLCYCCSSLLETDAVSLKHTATNTYRVERKN